MCATSTVCRRVRCALLSVASASAASASGSFSLSAASAAARSASVLRAHLLLGMQIHLESLAADRHAPARAPVAED